MAWGTFAVGLPAAGMAPARGAEASAPVPLRAALPAAKAFDAGLPAPIPATPPSAACAVSGDAVRLRVRWLDPSSGQPLCVDFPGDALVVAPAGSLVHVDAEMPPGRPARLRVASATAPGGPSEAKPWADRLALAMPADAPAQTRVARVEVARPDGTVFPSLNVWLQCPADAAPEKNGFGQVRVLGNFVGTYRPPSASGNDKVLSHPADYQPPRRFLRLTPETLAGRVTPRLTLGDLVVPTGETGERHTEWAPVNYALWQATETIRDALAARGIAPSAFKVISCFRTPPYNRQVGSNAFGRHVYGDAVDFMVDADGDGATDDLTGDGKVDRRDGLWMVALLEDLMADGKIPVGGIGCYTFATSDKKVTWHYDQRGHRATWGYHTNAGGRKSEFAWRSRRFADVDARDSREAAAKAQREGKKFWEPARDPLP